MTRPQSNLLVISDLHLGEDVRPHLAAPARQRVVRLERELESFLSHYTRTRRNSLPWTLLINGDMIDFMGVMILPGAATHDLSAISSDERDFGLAHDEKRSVEKLDHVIARHVDVFHRLAQFVAAGNELVVVVGNHDVEFHYPAVQERFVSWLRKLDDNADSERITFRPWFYYEESFVYVEHGHRFDRNCSFDDQLHPVDDSGAVQLSLAHTGTRYFANRAPTLDTAVGEEWGFVDYLKWASQQGFRTMLTLCSLYAHMVWRALWFWLTLGTRGGESARRTRHQNGLRRLSSDHSLPFRKIEELDGLKVKPALRTLRHIFSIFCVDRIGLWFFVGLAMLVSLIGLRGWWRPCAITGNALLALAVDAILARLRVFDANAVLRDKTHSINRIINAPFIVFGHSHAAETTRLHGGSLYINTGTWADNDDSRAFTHLILLRGAIPVAELCQWKNGQSAPYHAPTHPGHHTPWMPPGSAIPGAIPGMIRPAVSHTVSQ